IDRTRARLTVKRLKTIFGFKGRPHRDRKDRAPRLEVVVETPQYDLTIFKLHFGNADSEGLQQRRTRASLRAQADRHTPGSADFCFIAATPLSEVIEHLSACEVAI